MKSADLKATMTDGDVIRELKPLSLCGAARSHGNDETAVPLECFIARITIWVSSSIIIQDASSLLM
jgi:hypothetical protein